MSVYRRVSVAAAMLSAVVIVGGCDSDGGSALVGSSTATQSSSDPDGGGSVVGEGEGISDENNGDNSGVVPENDGNSGSESGTETNVDPDADPDGLANVDDREFEAMYTVRFESTWSADTHPTNFPDDPHFSPLTGAVHSEQVVIWQRGQNASDGIEEMAETGGTGPLVSEIQFAIDEGYAISSIQGGGIANSPGATTVDFLVNRDYPLVTLVSMLAPSPDWFIGINSQSLIDSNGEFVDSLTIELSLYDSGTDGGVRFTSADEDIPRSPIELVNSFPSDSDFLEGQPSVGSLVFTRTQ